MNANVFTVYGVVTTIQSMISVYQASTLSAEEITKIKPVLLLFCNSETWNVELSAKKRLLEWSAFALKQTFNIEKKILTINFNICKLWV